MLEGAVPADASAVARHAQQGIENILASYENKSTFRPYAAACSRSR
jgi:hypothetical protein